ncbi:MAG: hypothetical protein RLZZ361_1032 [Cyanobacteriota bacterium]|jgi:RNA polymerase primary sigma factor
MVKNNTNIENDFGFQDEPTDEDLQESEFFEQNLDTDIISKAEDEVVDIDDLEEEIKSKDKLAQSIKKKKEKKLSEDSVYLYLREIGKIPTLDNEEEINITKMIRRGGKDGEKSKRKLVQSNLRLVVSIAKRYSSNNIQLLDLIQEGNLGLMRAADKFDPSRGYKFSTFATWWIRQSISRSIADKSRTIRIPVHMIEHASKLRKVILDMTNKLGRTPTDEELMAVLEISREKLNEIQNLHMKTISISTKVGDSEDSVTIADFIESNGTWDSPDRYATAMLLRNELKNIINDLSDEEQSILILRYGLLEDENQKMYSFEELALMLEISKEKVKKLEAKALRKLKSHLLDKGEINEYF